ncbi:MAG: phosphatase PAP2 family protein [Rhodoblastus sp.]|nr:phosphatase PAP2 family protein [Rhodoblastus sp.]
MSFFPTVVVGPGLRRAASFEYLLFVLALVGLAAGGVAIALGLLKAPTVGLVVGDWYLLASGLVIVAAAGSQRRAILLTAGVVAMLTAALYLPLKLTGLSIELKPYVKIGVAFASATAIVTQFVIGFRRGVAWRDNRDLAVACFAVALVVTPLMSGWGIQISAVIPQTLDATALRMDDAVGFRLPAWLDQHVAASDALSYVVFHVYISISLVMVGYDLLAGDTRGWRMTKLMLVSSFLGFVAYFITPTVGVTYFDGYDASRELGDIIAQESAVASTLPRNAMPSLHATWGIMLIVTAIVRPAASLWRQGIAALYVVYGALTICGALIFGDHYLIDCIVALPFAASILLYFDEATTRARGGFEPCFWSGVVLLTVWIAMLRIGGDLINQPLVLAVSAASLAQVIATGVVMRNAWRATPGWT